MRKIDSIVSKRVADNASRAMITKDKVNKYGVTNCIDGWLQNEMKRLNMPGVNLNKMLKKPLICVKCQLVVFDPRVVCGCFLCCCDVHNIYSVETYTMEIQLLSSSIISKTNRQISCFV